MKRFLSLLLALLTLLCFDACGETESESSVVSSEAESSEESLPPPPTPVINGIELSDFTVVYKNNEAEIQKYKTVAYKFVDYVEETFGFRLKCVSDAIPASDNEIIFGIVSSRDISKGKTKNYGYGGYTVAIEGTKMIFAASYATGCNAAWEAFREKIEESEDGVFNEMEFTGEKKIIKVACVGDSITQGINSTDPKNMTYPAYLQEMLGLDYYVLNAGISGYSICKIDEYAYYKHNVYTQAKNLKPDVVLFALGTNDANPSPNQPYKNWDDPQYDRKNVFIQSTNELLDSFVQINPDVQIIMVLPASLFKVGADGWNAVDWTANIVEHVLPLLEQIAEERDLQTVEFFKWSEEHKEVFTDGLHPKDETYKTFAEHIYEEIKDTIKKPE